MQSPALSHVSELMESASRHHQAGRLSQAEPLYQEVLRLEPEHADALHFLGVLSHQLGRHEVAVVLISRAIVRNGGVPSFHNNLGNALRALGKLDEAENCYRQALAHLQAYPDAHYNLGGTLLAQGRLEAAAAAYAQALSLRPEFAEGYNQLGIVLFELSKLDEAVAAFARAVTYRPQYPEALSNLATALRQQGKRADAEALYRGALALKPDYAVAALGLSIAAIPVMPDTPAESREAAERFERALGELQAWDRSHPGLLGSAVGAAQPFSLAYRPVDVTASLSRYGELVSAAAAEYWGSRGGAPRVGAAAQVSAPRSGAAAEVGAPRVAAAGVAGAHADSGTATRRERVRLVIVSGQIRRTHPVWEIVLRGLIAHLDRQKFEVILYHTGHQADDETDWARAHVDSFVHGTRSTEGLLALIGRDQPDVLFYPEIGMDAPSCALAALRLAPLQIAGWGHPVTTGLPTIDWFVSGELLEGPAAQQHYREKLVRLPGTGVCTEAMPLQPQRGPAPPRGPGIVRFALCHQPIKFDPADDVLFVRIAQAVGACELWLSSPRKLSWTANRLYARLAAAFESSGLEPAAYLRVAPWLTHNQFAGFLDEMDIYLDCPNFSGYTTAWQALHRGLPIVTLEGAFLRQRLAAGLLRQIGVTEGIVASAGEYVEVAVRWANELRQVGGPSRWDERRRMIIQAASKADGNRLAVAAFERAVLAELTGPSSRHPSEALSP